MDGREKRHGSLKWAHALKVIFKLVIVFTAHDGQADSSSSSSTWKHRSCGWKKIHLSFFLLLFQLYVAEEKKIIILARKKNWTFNLLHLACLCMLEHDMACFILNCAILCVCVYYYHTHTHTHTLTASLFLFFQDRAAAAAAAACTITCRIYET